jgi:DNA-binding transcriptional MerR regulator
MLLGPFSLSDLAERSGVERRTIRSWIAQGLLPAPTTIGRNASYEQEHLDRLLAICELRDRGGLSLAQIRARLLTLPEAEIAALARRREEAGTGDGPAAALDYIRSVRARRAPPSESGADSRALMNAGVTVPHLMEDLTAFAPGVADGWGTTDAPMVEPCLRITVSPEIDLLVRGTPNPERVVQLQGLAASLRRALAKGKL